MVRATPRRGMTQRKKNPGCVTATRGKFATVSVICYAMASTIALKVALGRIAFEVLIGSGS